MRVIEMASFSKFDSGQLAKQLTRNHLKCYENTAIIEELPAEFLLCKRVRDLKQYDFYRKLQ